MGLDISSAEHSLFLQLEVTGKIYCYVRVIQKVMGLALDFIQRAGESYLPSRFEWVTGEEMNEAVNALKILNGEVYKIQKETEDKLMVLALFHRALIAFRTEIVLLI